MGLNRDVMAVSIDLQNSLKVALTLLSPEIRKTSIKDELIKILEFPHTLL